MSNNLLEINNLFVNADDKEILKGINLNIKKGETHERLQLQMQYLIIQNIKNKVVVLS